MNTDAFGSLTRLLSQLEQKHISYALAHNREESIMVLVSAPGERWEIEVLSDGGIEIEKFVSNGEIFGSESLEELFARYEDSERQTKEACPASIAIPMGKVA